MIVAEGASDQGRVRKNNEDNFAVLPPPRLVSGLDSLLIVADGMGGAQAGEVASGLAIQELTRWFSADADRTLRGTDTDWPGELTDAVVHANYVVRSTAVRDADKFGMGTTLVVAALVGDTLYVANVGDSRAYLVSDSTVYQITRDHSWVAEQVRAGAIAMSVARRHPRRNVLTRAIGVADNVAPDVTPYELMPGDHIVLCSDGLHGMVDDEEIRKVTTSCPPAVAVHSLIDLANERGAPDNVTAIVAQYR
ncbi:MAG TPA: Stp1/IreP family PP2C-type Ser/Thr phosphatase [Chloroflexota bacterium]|nr:Stp1/IreP family PP2C-type Ser/Thr phosphatase [Chloroflexota bacterium]